MHTWTLPALLLMMTACAGGGELSKPNPPPVWPMEGVSPDDLPTGENVPSPTAPPAMPDTDAPPAADTDTPEAAPQAASPAAADTPPAAATDSN